MKNLVIRTVFVLTLLLALGGVLGGVSSATAHAASLTTTAAAAPNITNPGCNGRTDFFQIYSDTSGEKCFANTGYTSLNLTVVYAVCSGNNDADLYTTSGIYYIARWHCYGFTAATVTGLNIR